MPIVTILTDFGMRDSYVAQMKGEVLRNCPDCNIVDVTHEVQRHHILQGAFLLGSIVSYFPRDTVHIAVVDPEVGSQRLPIVIKCRNGFLVGPDNGLLVQASQKLGSLSAYQIQPSKHWKSRISSTFHGRDIFAIAGGRLANGTRVEDFGPKVSNIVPLEAPVAMLQREVLKCHVMHVDRFGNIITNAENRILDGLRLRTGQRVVVRCRLESFQGKRVRAYYEVSKPDLAVVKGSQGYVEVACREDDAAAFLDVGILDELVIAAVR